MENLELLKTDAEILWVMSGEDKYAETWSLKGKQMIMQFELSCFTYNDLMALGDFQLNLKDRW